MSVREKKHNMFQRFIQSMINMFWSPIPLRNSPGCFFGILCSHVPRIVVLQNEEMLETEKGRLESEKLQWTQARSDE